jgi:putative ABC transport system permease protein
MVVSSSSAGVKKAQGTVLYSRYGVGTDITVSKTVTSSFRSGQSFSFPGASSRPSAGTHISRNTLRATTPTLSFSDVAKVTELHGVAATTGGLVLTDTSFSGTIPSYSGGSY